MPTDLSSPPLEPGSDQSGRVLRQFRIVFNAVKLHFRQIETAAGVGGAQVWALSVIQGRPGIGVSDLGRAMDVHQSTASNLVRALLDRQLISTVRDRDDRRALGLHLSESGAAVLASVPGPFAGILPGALAELDPAILARLEHDLDALIASLNADRSAANTLLAEL